MGFDQHGLRILDDNGCLDLLRSVRLGRIALTDRALPLILPVAFAIVDREIVFKVGQGALARAANAGNVVCFEADWIDDELVAAWSVTAVGQLSLVDDAARILELQQLNLGSWSASSPQFVALSPQLMSGRSRTDGRPTFGGDERP